MSSMDTHTTLLAALSIINIISFVVMMLDKRRSMNKSDHRIPEGILFFLASIYGSLGILAGMLLLRHKIRKWYFAVGVPALILQQTALVYYIAEGVTFLS